MATNKVTSIVAAKAKKQASKSKSVKAQDEKIINLALQVENLKQELANDETKIGILRVDLDNLRYTNSNLHLQILKQETKLEQLIKLIQEAFNNDGVDDITLIKDKLSIWSILMNISAVTKLLKAIIDVLKNK